MASLAPHAMSLQEPGALSLAGTYDVRWLLQYQRFREQARMARKAAVAHRNMHPLAMLLQTQPEAEESESATSKVSHHSC